MRGFWYLLCFLLIAALPLVVAAEVQGQYTIEVPVYAEIQPVSVAGHPVLVTAGRSVGAVGKVAAVPVRAVVKIVKAKPARKIAKAVAQIKPARRVAALGGRLICPRRRCN